MLLLLALSLIYTGWEGKGRWPSL
uniref:Uncharacterized protein n=1 Tax=Arundo donax TaxID=35708 RepID=A0A0A9CH47_ARUDO